VTRFENLECGERNLIANMKLYKEKLNKRKYYSALKFPNSKVSLEMQEKAHSVESWKQAPTSFS